LKVAKGPKRREKKKKNRRFVSWKGYFFLLAIFLIVQVSLHFKDDI